MGECQLLFSSKHCANASTLLSCVDTSNQVKKI